MATSRSLPKSFFDGHHHYVDTVDQSTTFHQFLTSILPDVKYLPEDYHRDVVAPVLDNGINFMGSVHMEAIPSDGLGEAQWVSKFMNGDNSSKYPPNVCRVKAIVASCNLAAEDAEQHLQQLIDPTNFSLASSASPSFKSPVKGIRWILDCVGKFNGNDATHIATKRHDGIDYLRGGGVKEEGGAEKVPSTSSPLCYDGSVVPEFERGFALLEKYGLTFDLQCAPVQLPKAAELCSRHPNIKVVIDHMGKPRMLLGKDLVDGGDDHHDTVNPNLHIDQDELKVWRDGMKLMSKCPNVYVKISMLGYIIPGWTRTEQRTGVIKSLVRETVQMFGPNRCMVCTNYWKDDATSDSDGLSNAGPSPVSILSLLYGFLKDEYTEDDLELIFCKTAASFYGVECSCK